MFRTERRVKRLLWEADARGAFCATLVVPVKRSQLGTWREEHLARFPALSD